MCGFCTVWTCEAYVIMWVWIWWVLLRCGCFGNGKQHSLTTLTEAFPCFYSVVRQIPGLNSQSRGTDRISSEVLSFVLCLSLCYAIVFMLFCCSYVVLLFVLLCYYLCCPMYWLCVMYHCHRVLTQLQLTNISISISRSVPFRMKKVADESFRENRNTFYVQ